MRAFEKKTTPGGDKQLLVYLLGLFGFGLIALISATGPLAYSNFHDTYFFIKKQILFGAIPGIILFIFFSRLDYRKILKMAWPLYIGTIILLAAVFVPGVGAVINGSRNWIHIKGFSFQPSEISKIAIITLLAALLSHRKYHWDDWQSSLLPVLAIIAPVLLLVHDVGTLSILVMAIFFILFVAEVPTRYLVVLGSLCVTAFVVLVIAAPYRMQRLTTFLHPALDPQGVGYQINQAFLAVGSGGFWGLGFNQSRQKYQYLPEVNADSIFAIIAEEMGFFVSAGVIFLILLIGWRGLKIADRAPELGGKILVTGIMVWFMWQSFLNIGAMVGALPLTGVPLPFISHGGTALMSMLSAMGMVMSVSKATPGSV